jgi:hypothetical protein
LHCGACFNKADEWQQWLLISKPLIMCCFYKGILISLFNKTKPFFYYTPGPAALSFSSAHFSPPLQNHEFELQGGL